MDDNFLLTNDILWDYADGFLNPMERKKVEAYLSAHPEWRAQFLSILDEKREMANLPLDIPKSGFADRVMAAWSAEWATKTAQITPKSDWVVRIIAMVFVLFILATAIAMVVAALRIPAFDIPAFEIPQVSLPALDWSAVFNNSFLQIGFLLVFTFIVLRLFEKIVLQRLVLQKLA